MANTNQNPHVDNNSQDDSDADAFAILSLLFIAYAAIIYYLSH